MCVCVCVETIIANDKRKMCESERLEGCPHKITHKRGILIYLIRCIFILYSVSSLNFISGYI